MAILLLEAMSVGVSQSGFGLVLDYQKALHCNVVRWHYCITVYNTVDMLILEAMFVGVFQSGLGVVLYRQSLVKTPPIKNISSNFII